ncbi:MAG: hypothetical protein HOJ15_03425 [Candidatus Jacksonbacteria bacterium]|nr:hypothetical protein [Candidatus Jacksonbacteria bacterium]MBT6757179.1 hypothetical protein [Candidatus Jacksonbacteria bacterium]MBT7008712.1 hypothetical protein [Candidatus Jacksonbacteria bacterium]MBT7338235.1 hypothetical protein [Candidatus Jacksonbacteria bacterium]
MDISAFYQKFKMPLIITGGVVLVGLLVWLLWLIFFKPATLLVSQPPLTPDADLSGGLKPSETGSPTTIILDQNGQPIGLTPDTGLPVLDDLPQIDSQGSIFNVSDVALGGLTKITPIIPQNSYQPPAIVGNSVRYYDATQQRFIERQSDGSTQRLSEDRFPSAEKVVWSKNGDKAVLEFPDGFNIIYDFKTKQQVTLPKEAEGFSFSPNSQQLAYKMQTNDFWQNWLRISSTDGERVVQTEHLGDNGKLVQVDWSPSNQVVAMYTKGETLDTQKIYPLGQHQENLPSLRVAGRGFESEWDNTGDRLLYSVRNESTDHNPRLWITEARSDTMGENNIPLNIQTWAHKCTFTPNDERVICAVPKELPLGAGLFPELAADVEEDFYSIDIFTGQSTFLATPAAIPPGFKATDLTLSEDGALLVFRDESRGGIYEMRLR